VRFRLIYNFIAPALFFAKTVNLMSFYRNWTSSPPLSLALLWRDALIILGLSYRQASRLSFLPWFFLVFFLPREAGPDVSVSMLTFFSRVRPALLFSAFFKEVPLIYARQLCRLSNPPPSPPPRAPLRISSMGLCHDQNVFVFSYPF